MTLISMVLHQTAKWMITVMVLEKIASTLFTPGNSLTRERSYSTIYKYSYSSLLCERENDTDFSLQSVLSVLLEL